MKSEQPSDGGSNLSTNLAWVHFFARTLACTVDVFLHEPGSFGARYIGPQAAAGAIVLVVFPALFTGQDPTPMMVMAAAFVFMCAVVRSKAMRRHARGEPEEHSYYNGRPGLMAIFRRSSELSVKSVLEPVLTGLTGMFLMEWNRPLGVYLAVAAIGMIVSMKACERVERARALDMNDAFLEQRRTAESWRRMRGD